MDIESLNTLKVFWEKIMEYNNLELTCVKMKKVFKSQSAFAQSFIM